MSVLIVVLSCMWSMCASYASSGLPSEAVAIDAGALCAAATIETADDAETPLAGRRRVALPDAARPRRGAAFLAGKTETSSAVSMQKFAKKKRHGS